jgi:hypothetical protein
MRVVSVLITTATASMTANVTRYCVSDTAKVRYGVTKKKSKAATLRRDAKIDGPRPSCQAASTVPRRYTMMRFAGAKWRNMRDATALQTATTPAAFR